MIINIRHAQKQFSVNSALKFVLPVHIKDEVHISFITGFDAFKDTVVSEPGLSSAWFGERVSPVVPMVQ